VEHLESEVRASRHTVRAYRGDVEAFAAAVETRHDREATVSDLNIREVRAHLAELHGLRSTSTISRKLSALRSFGEFLRREGDLPENEISLIGRPKKGRPLPVALPVEDVNQVVDGGHRPGARGLRDRALLEVLYGAGLRVSEAVALDLDHLRWQGDSADLRVVHGKGGKERIVPL